jgi:hypothetical protein
MSPRYRITVTGRSRDAMLDLVRKYRIAVFDHGSRSTEAGYVVDAVAEPREIARLKRAGYQVQQHDDMDKVGKARQQEVGQGDRYKSRRR